MTKEQVISQLKKNGKVVHVEENIDNETITQKIEFIHGPDTYNYSCYNDFNKLKGKVISDNIEDAAEFFINQIINEECLYYN